MALKREELAKVLNPVPDYIDDERGLCDYYECFFHDLSSVLLRLQSYLKSEQESIPVDFENYIQQSIIKSINRLVQINKGIQQHTHTCLKKGFAFNEVAYA